MDAKIILLIVASFFWSISGIGALTDPKVYTEPAALVRTLLIFITPFAIYYLAYKLNKRTRDKEKRAKFLEQEIIRKEEELKNEIKDKENLKNQIVKAAEEKDNLLKENEELAKNAAPEITEKLKLIEESNLLKDDITRLNKEISVLNIDISTLKATKENLKTSIKAKRKEIIPLDNELLLQSFGLYTPIYDFATSNEYKEKLSLIRDIQKNYILTKSAVNYIENWTVNNSLAEGKKWNEKNIKQILHTFNIECETLISKVKFNNFDSLQKRIEASFKRLNKMNESCRVSITEDYLDLKIQELHLAHEYQIKKQEEKEERLRLRAEAKEEAKLKKELEEARRNTYKEQQHFEKALKNLEEQMKNPEVGVEQLQLLNQKSQAIKNQLHDIDEKLADLDYRENNQRAGYVYVISNIGAFGENVYKIGMTRRLEPLERIDELSIASVPFKFDVHAMIFTEDAPALENALHKAFENKKVNMVNKRKEFFNVTLEEIEAVVKANYDKTVDFVSIAPAEQYRESLKMKEAI